MNKIGVTVGDVYGRLTVVEEAGRDKFLNKIWRCHCCCGGEKDVSSPCLRQGLTKSCGCISKERPSHTKHGGHGSRLYVIWKSMRERCNDPNAKAYKYYGGRGICICKEWDDFSVFRDWSFSSGYENNLTIDRIDNDGIYCPENCKWSTYLRQSRNKTNTLLYTIDGVTRCFADWCEFYCVDYKAAHQRMSRGHFPFELERIKKDGA